MPVCMSCTGASRENGGCFSNKSVGFLKLVKGHRMDKHGMYASHTKGLHWLIRWFPMYKFSKLKLSKEIISRNLKKSKEKPNCFNPQCLSFMFK